MAPPEPVTEPNEKADEPWKPPKRPGKPGEEYDELGMEMAPNARVWKKYVEETDRMDKELVEGWNNSLDIILIFAALFSAISTAFVIESSKDLKPDYSQTSAQTLQLMSQTLSAIARGSPLNDSDAAIAEAQDFTPSSSAVAVNTLWFLSLGLSVAVSLIAILAKEWCHSFMAGRVGSMLRQARLRQQRWDGIERWKMKEILYVLPLLMHTALLLFAVGLSLYLWDIDIRVALPLVITTSLSGLFYVVTVSLPLFFRFCPYTTALARFLYPYWLGVLGNRRTMDIFGAMIASLGWILYAWARMKDIAHHGLRSLTKGARTGNDIEATGNSPPDTPSFSFREKIKDAHEPIQEWVESMRAMFSTDRSQLVENDTPMDNVTSSTIAWMIMNCEDSRSVDMALRSLAGAEQALPRLPLWECGAVDLVCPRISDSWTALESRGSGDVNQAQNTLLEDASLYSRSLCFLTAFIAGEGLDIKDISHPRFVVNLNGNHELVAKMQNIANYAGFCCRYYLPNILNYAWEQPTPRYDLVAYALNAVPVKADMRVWNRMEAYSGGQCQKQQELVQHLTSGKVSSLPSGAVVALINGITKSYFYDTPQSPKLLVDLLHFFRSARDSPPCCIYAVAVGLAVAAFATGNYAGDGTKTNKSQSENSHLELARDVYARLTETTDDIDESVLLNFGLLSSLNHKTDGQWTFDTAGIETIKSQLNIYWGGQSYHEVMPNIPVSFDRGHHVAHVLSELIDTAACDMELDGSTRFAPPVLLRIEAALSGPVCEAGCDQIVPLLTQHFTSTDSAQLKRLCLRGIKYSLEYSSDRVDAAMSSLVRTGFLRQVLEVTTSSRNDPGVIACCMEFLWEAGRALLHKTNEGNPETRRSVARSLLESLDNPFKTSATEDGLPQNRDEVGLANLWLPKIDEICRSSPQSVLDSNLLSAMIDFYKYEEHTSLKPRAEELSGAFENTWTWLQILRYWEKSCQEAIEKEAGYSTPLDKEPETIPAICSLGRPEREGNFSLDIHDWSI